MIKKLIDILNSKKLDGYFIEEVDRETYQLYFVKENVETVRSGSFKDIAVTVFVKHDGKLGDAKVNVSPSSSSEEISEVIDNAITNAMNVYNEPYELVKDEKCEFKGTNKSLKEMAEDIRDAIFSVKGSNGSKLNATEIFVNKINRHVLNSNGLDKKETKYHCMIEAIPTFDKKDSSVEIYAQKNFSDFTKEEISTYIKEKLYEVEARANAKKLELDKVLDVTIRAEELSEVLDEYSWQLGYSTLYSHSNIINVGDDIQKGNGDKLTITMKNKVSGCSNSVEFDSEGSSFKETIIIKDGKAVNVFGGNRFAQYLNKPNTGNLPINVVNTGTLSKDDLKNKTYLECLQFSGIQCDILNDYIGGEVRLAILHKDGLEIPVCGFSIAGKLSEVINEIKLSKDKDTLPYYSGPAFALLKDLQIL